MLESFCRVMLCFIVAIGFVVLVKIAFLFGKIIGIPVPLFLIIVILTCLENKYHG